MDSKYNTTLLNIFFTSNEFDFIEHMDSDIESSYKALEKHQKNKDILEKLINELNDSIYFKRISNEDNEKEKNLLQAAKNALELINFNINMIQSNNEISNSIKKSIIDLLIKIEGDEENISPDKYVSEISDLKSQIGDISNKNENLKTKLKLNDDAISSFFNTDSVQNYFKLFSIKIDSENENNAIQEESDNKNVEPTFENNSNNIVENNNILLVSEKQKKVYLPFSKEEVLQYLKQYPDQYNSFEDVIKKEFIFPVDFYLKHPVIARFREAYSLIRDREAKSVLDAFKYAMEIMFHYDLNPVIIAACKSQAQLDHYIQCLAENDLTKFDDFEIKFEVSPLKV